jgi:DNA-binding response OmpR family regulator
MSSEAASRRPHVLVVDDSPDVTGPLETTLKAVGYRVSIAGDGAQALDLIRRQSPDVVLLDLMMPVVDGWKVLTRVRSWAHGSPPIIVVSALASQSEQLLARTLGAVDYVVKPFDMTHLIERIDLALARVSAASA